MSTSKAKVKSINEEALVDYIMPIDFSKTNSETYQNLGASLSSGDVRAKIIHERLKEVCEEKESENYKGIAFKYVVYDLGFEYKMKDNDNEYRIKGILSTSRSIHLMLDETAPF